jgi:ribulose 1,5-bisphosphate synthetase/thiazole synthase
MLIDFLKITKIKRIIVQTILIEKNMNLNINAQKKGSFDAIVVGSGMTGGYAAKELTEKGLKVLMIERGREIKHGEDYDTAMKQPWEIPHR